MDPRKPGGRYYCGYWWQEYDVLETWSHGGVQWFRVLWADGRQTKHCTAWDPRADRVIRQPA